MCSDCGVRAGFCSLRIPSTHTLQLGELFFVQDTRAGTEHPLAHRVDEPFNLSIEIAEPQFARHLPG